MTSIGRRGLSQAKSSLTTKFDGRVTLPLADVLERVVQLQGQLDELTSILTSQIEVETQTTELLGRLLATSAARLDALEDSLSQLAPPPVGSTRSPEGRPRTKTAAKPPSPADEAQPGGSAPSE